MVIAQLNEFFDYKNKLMEDILTDEELVKLINENATLETAGELAYTQVFPAHYIPETTHDGSTFVCFDVDILSVPNKTYYKPAIYIWVISHRSRLRLPEGGVRTDKICKRLCELINGSRFYGLGELKLYSSKVYAPQTDYTGKVLTFDTADFNRPHMGGVKPTPANRKDGK